MGTEVPAEVPTEVPTEPPRGVPTKVCPLIFLIDLRLKISGHTSVGTAPGGSRGGYPSAPPAGTPMAFLVGTPAGTTFRLVRVQRSNICVAQSRRVGLPCGEGSRGLGGDGGSIILLPITTAQKGPHVRCT